MELEAGARLSLVVANITKVGQVDRWSSMVTTTMSNSLNQSSSQDIREEARNKSMVMVDTIMRSRTFTDRMGDKETSKFCHQCLF